MADKIQTSVRKWGRKKEVKGYGIESSEIEESETERHEMEEIDQLEDCSHVV